MEKNKHFAKDDLYNMQINMYEMLKPYFVYIIYSLCML